MPAREASIHWHGQSQASSPWQDGVPYVTQCPIASNSLFRYDFKADTSGTHFYHSHSGLQLFDGLSGPFIVHTSAETDPVSSLYDYDLFSHTIQIRDWMHELIDVRYPGYKKNQNLTTILPVSYLINGLGSYTETDSNKGFDTPLAEFNVKANRKYRFRIITDTSTTCSLQFTIENHPMLLIAADGYPVEPKMVRTLYLSAADSYDVVITTDKPSRPYWIRVQGYQGRFSLAHQKAILRYEGADVSLPATTSNTPELFDVIPNLPELNNVRKPCHNNNTDNLCLDQIHSLYKAPERLLKDVPDQRFIFEARSNRFTETELFDTKTYHRYYLPAGGPGSSPVGGMYEDTINNKSSVFIPIALLHDPKNPLIDQMKCPDECANHCRCLHLIKLERTFPPFGGDHPFHIHGHYFRVMKLGTQEQLMSDPDRLKINATNQYPMIRDSMPIKPGGYAVVRFIADNPSFWPLHCHFSDHNGNGMQIVLQVGEPEQFPQLPGDWPTCGNYLPPVY